MTIRVLVVDDQALFRAGIALILGTQPDLELVGECGSGEEAVEFVSAHPDVDLVLMDVQMPGIGGLAATTAITALANAPKVLVLTTFDDRDTVGQAIASGASGFVLKDARPELLLSSLRSVAEGNAVLAGSTSLKDIAGGTAPVPPPPAAFETLTASEESVLRLVATGLSNREIAAELFLSVSTVKSYVSRILMKLGLRDRVQLALFALKHGLMN